MPARRSNAARRSGLSRRGVGRDDGALDDAAAGRNTRKMALEVSVPQLVEHYAAVTDEPSDAAAELTGVAAEASTAVSVDPDGADESTAVSAAPDDAEAASTTGEHMSARDVRRRAVTGAVVDGLRAIGVQLVGLVGAIVTARLLTPYDFGLVAIGLTVFAFGTFLSDGGVGVALIRRPEPPTRSELKALVAFQLGADLLLVVGIAVVMLPFGLVGQVTTVIVAALPFGAFRAPAYILYERRLDFRPMAVVEVVETIVYYVWAITTIILGWGVWGLATAFVVRAAVGLTLLLTLSREGRVLPVPSWKRVRPLLGFGFRYQAVGLLQMLDDQLVNIAVATFGGVALLGLWGVAWRILQIPISLFQALWRVSFPGMSKLIAAKQDVGATIERVIGLVAIGTGVLAAPLAASAAPWIHVLLGAKWESSAGAIPPACFALMVGVPISTALGGYLWAIGSASVPLWATLLGIPAMALILLPLLPVIGVVAVGLAYVAAAVTECVVFVRAARRTTTFRIGARFAIPVLIGTVAGAGGWLVARWIGPDLAGALASSAVALIVFVVGLSAVRRADMTEAWRVMGRGLRGAAAAPATS